MIVRYSLVCLAFLNFYVWVMFLVEESGKQGDYYLEICFVDYRHKPERVCINQKKVFFPFKYRPMCTWISLAIILKRQETPYKCIHLLNSSVIFNNCSILRVHLKWRPSKS